MNGKRILALDPGTVRIGIALSDELGWTAQPLETYERRTAQADLAHIRELVERHEVGEVVMGLPLHMNGRAGIQAELVETFKRSLEEVLTVPIVLWDERLTTQEAEDLLIAGNVSRKKRKGVVDRVAAAILLRSYLASRADDHSSSASADDDHGDP